MGICLVILSQLVLPNKQQKLPKIFGLSTIKEYVMYICSHKVFPGIFQVMISNGTVAPPTSPLPDKVDEGLIPTCILPCVGAKARTSPALNQEHVKV